MAEEFIKVSYREEDILEKTDSEKLTILLKIAIANRRDLAVLNKVVYGDEEEIYANISRTWIL